MTQLERLFKKTKLNGDCVEWQASTWKDGYGQFSIKGKSLSAHRASEQLVNGRLSRDIVVLHKCDNVKCINPNHLYRGTQQDNIRDRDFKKRQAIGENHGRAKLSLESVKEIKDYYSKGDVTYKVLSKQFGVSQNQISRIINNKVWNKGDS